ncbi:MAG: hypothetical protein MJK18_15545, partial [Bdellovibrionales bacterium]|nr:hypothetical protein [Bdellovibrionales bacterium]
KSVFEPKKRSLQIKKIMGALVVLAMGYMVYDGQKWGKHYPERLWYKALSSIKMTSAKDEARMAFVCKQIENHKCSAESYTKALAKAPKSHSLAGALGIELAKIGQHDRAILTFQNFFSYEDGEAEHKRHYAIALSGAGYTDDATEWFYQALKTKSNHFDAAKELVEHLAKNENYVEALSVIGHYHTLFPKTRKKWSEMTDKVKNQYSAYTSQYDVKEIKISGLNKYLYAPVHFSNSSETQLFMVDPESEYLTLDLTFLQDHAVNFKDLGEKEVMATNGQYIKGTEVVLPELTVGPFALKNVKAIACNNCAFMLGKKVMKRLNFQAKNTKGVKYITLSSK